MVANDNNFPFSVGRGPDIDNNEIVLLELDTPLNLDRRLGAESLGNLTPELVFGTTNADSLEGGIDFQGIEDLIFTGAAGDLVDASTAAKIVGMGPRNRIYSGSGNDEIVAGNSDRLFGGNGNDTLEGSVGRGGNRLYGGDGNDEIVAGTGDRLFGGGGNDTLDASIGGGDNRIYGGDGEDVFFLGTGDRALGGEGNDRFFVGTGGNNTLTGGAGSDQFWIANSELPVSSNTITDFELGTDVIGIGGLGLSFNDLRISADGNNAIVATGDRNLAILFGINPTSLSADNFVFV